MKSNIIKLWQDANHITHEKSTPLVFLDISSEFIIPNSRFYFEVITKIISGLRVYDEEDGWS